MLKPEERQKILEDIECEGFMYAFYNYDSYNWINDEEFHKRLDDLKKAAESLADYCYIPRSMI